MASSIHENDERKLADRLRREAERFRPEFSETLHERIIQRIADQRRPTPPRPKTRRSRRSRRLALTATLTAVSLAALSLMIWSSRGPLEENLAQRTTPGDTVREVGPLVNSVPDARPRPSPELPHKPRGPFDALDPRPSVGIRVLANIPQAVAGQMELLMKGTFGRPLGELEHDLDYEARIAADRIMARLPLEMMLAISEEQ